MTESNLSLGISKFKHLTEDYTLKAVPEHINTSGIRVALILCAIGITLPVLSYSSWLAMDNGLGSSSYAFVIGSWIVMIIALFSGLVGSRTRLSTYMILQFSFGTKGAKIVNLLMAIILLGWYSVTCEEFGVAIVQASKNLLDLDINVQLAIFLGSVMMTLTTLFGFQMIEKFSMFSVPILGVFLIYVAFQATGDGSVALDWSRTASSADEMSLISVTIGLFVLAAVLMPDFTRYCPNDKQSYIASIIGVGITFPLVAIVAAVPAVRVGETDIVMIMAGMGVVASAIFVLVFATWSTNITNLYSSTLTISTLMTKVSSWKITLIGSAIAITPLVGVYVVDYFFVSKQNYDLNKLKSKPSIGWPAIIAWGAGAIVGYLSENAYITILGLSAIDALLVTSTLYLFIAKLTKK